ncbi:MAG: TonB-dependent receptor [Sphingomicrobium sp.]
MAADEAIRRLCSQANARAIKIDDATFRIVRASPARARRPALIVTWAPRRLAPDPAQLNEIVVVGSRRDVALRDYPGPVLILGDDELNRGLGLKGSEALEDSTPLVFSTHLGPGRNKLFLRGIADSSFIGTTRSTIAQYFGEARLNFAGPDPDLRLFDVRKVEILPGPEATLYGSGALGGVIRIQPNRPDFRQLSAHIDVGGSANQAQQLGYDAAAAVNLPLITDRLAARIVAYGSLEPAYVDALLISRSAAPPQGPAPNPRPLQRLSNTNGISITGARAMLRGKAGGWTFDAMGLTQRIHGADAQYTNGDESRAHRAALLQPYSDRYRLANLAVRKDWTTIHVSGSATVSRQQVEQVFDATQDKLPAAYVDRLDYIVHSADIRVWTDGSSGRNWLLGASALSATTADRRALGPIDAIVPITSLDNRQSDIAVFGESSFSLAAGINATVGLRAGRSSATGRNVGVTEATAATSTANYLLPSASLSLRPTDHALFYARYQEGYRPAGFSIFGDIVERFRPDRMRSVELGGRFGGPTSVLSADAAVAIIHWRDVQADSLDLSGLPNIINLGDGRIETASASLRWKVNAGLSVESSIVLNRSRLVRSEPSVVVPAKSKLPNVAPVDARLSVDQSYAFGRLHGSAFASARYVGRSTLGAGPILGKTQGPSLSVDGGAQFGTQRGSVTLAISNIFNASANRFAFGTPIGLGEENPVTPLRPRTVRIGYEAAF